MLSNQYGAGYKDDDNESEDELSEKMVGGKTSPLAVDKDSVGIPLKANDTMILDLCGRDESNDERSGEDEEVNAGIEEAVSEIDNPVSDDMSFEKQAQMVAELEANIYAEDSLVADVTDSLDLEAPHIGDMGNIPDVDLPTTEQEVVHSDDKDSANNPMVAALDTLETGNVPDFFLPKSPQVRKALAGATKSGLVETPGLEGTASTPADEANTEEPKVQDQTVGSTFEECARDTSQYSHEGGEEDGEGAISSNLTDDAGESPIEIEDLEAGQQDIFHASFDTLVYEKEVEWMEESAKSLPSVTGGSDREDEEWLDETETVEENRVPPRRWNREGVKWVEESGHLEMNIYGSSDSEDESDRGKEKDTWGTEKTMDESAKSLPSDTGGSEREEEEWLDEMEAVEENRVPPRRWNRECLKWVEESGHLEMNIYGSNDSEEDSNRGKEKDTWGTENTMDETASIVAFRAMIQKRRNLFCTAFSVVVCWSIFAAVLGAGIGFAIRKRSDSNGSAP